MNQELGNLPQAVADLRRARALLPTESTQEALAAAEAEAKKQGWDVESVLGTVGVRLCARCGSLGLGLSIRALHCIRIVSLCEFFILLNERRPRLKNRAVTSRACQVLLAVIRVRFQMLLLGLGYVSGLRLCLGDVGYARKGDRMKRTLRAEWS